jgi:hypothetical protein
MADDLTPKVVRQYDSAEFEAGGGVRKTTIVQFTIGKFGPFEHVFDRAPDKYAIEQVMLERKRALEGIS